MPGWRRERMNARSSNDCATTLPCMDVGYLDAQGQLRLQPPGGLGKAPVAHPKRQRPLRREGIHKCRGRMDAQERPNSRRRTAKACPASVASALGMAPRMWPLLRIPALAALVHPCTSSSSRWTSLPGWLPWYLYALWVQAQSQPDAVCSRRTASTAYWLRRRNGAGAPNPKEPMRGKRKCRLNAGPP